MDPTPEAALSALVAPSSHSAIGVLAQPARGRGVAIAAVGLLALANVSCGSSSSVRINATSSDWETVATESTAPSTSASPTTEISFHGADWTFSVPPPSAGQICYMLDGPAGVQAPPTTALRDCFALSLIENVQLEPMVFFPTTEGVVVAGFLAAGYEIDAVKQTGGTSPAVQQVKGRAFAMTFAQDDDVSEITLKKNGVEVPCKVVDGQPIALVVDCHRSSVP